MRHDLISLSISHSRLARGGLIGFGILTTLLLANAQQLPVGYKLISLLLSLLGISYHLWHRLNPIPHIDILLHLRRLVIWDQTIPRLATLTQLKSVANCLIIIEYQARQQHTLYIFADSVNAASFKQLLRYSKWQQI